MSLLERNRYLLAQPFSKNVETYVCPISKSKNEVSDGLKIAGGWRFFNELRVIQKKENVFSESIMTPLKLIEEAKNESKEALQEAENVIDSITNKRLSFSNLNMSQPHVMGIINSTPDSFYKKSRSTNSSFAIKKSNQMISDGASIIDIGGESSRPGAKKKYQLKRRCKELSHL